MKILLAHNDYAKFSGEENSVRVMTQVLESHGHSLHRFHRSSENIGGSTWRKVHALFAGIYSTASKGSVEKILDEVSIDIVQVQNLYPFISPSILPVCRAHNIPVVMRCPNYRLFCPNGLHLSHGEVCERCLGGREWNCIVRNCERNLPKSIGYAARNAFARKTRMILDNVSVFIVQSEFQRQRFINGGIPPEKIAILHNVAYIANDDQENSIGEMVSFAGRVSPEKGIYDFLCAASKLPRIQFSVAGSVNAMPEVLSAAKANVNFEGFLHGEAFTNFYRKSRIFVVPSNCFEGFPNVIAQAMAFGKPVIASRLGALPEIVEDGVTGLLFEPGNTVDLTEKIEYLWSRPDLCRAMGEAGLEKARRKYSEDRYYKTLMEIYETAIRSIPTSTVSV